MATPGKIIGPVVTCKESGYLTLQCPLQAGATGGAPTKIASVLSWGELMTPISRTGLWLILTYINWDYNPTCNWGDTTLYRSSSDLKLLAASWAVTAPWQTLGC